MHTDTLEAGCAFKARAAELLLERHALHPPGRGVPGDPDRAGISCVMREDVGPSLAAIVTTIAVFVGAPLLGLLGAVVSKARGKGIAASGCAVALVTWAGTCLASAALSSLTVPPSAFLEVGAALGGIAIGAAVLGWLMTDPVVEPPSRRTRQVVVGAVGVAILATVAVVWFLVRTNTWPARLALPDDAEVLEEHALSDRFLGDFTYRMRARMDEASYRAWMREMEVEATNDPRRHGAGPDPIDRRCWARGEYDGEVATFESGCM